MKYVKHTISYKGRRTYGSDVEAIVSTSGGYAYINTGGGSYTPGPTPSQEPTITPSSEGSPNITPQQSEAYQFAFKAYETSENDTPGHWTANVDTITNLYDGLLLPIRISTNCFRNNEGYNTLNVNDTGAKLVWFDYNKPVNQEVLRNDELLLVYRQDAGRFAIPSGGTGELVSDVVPGDGTVRGGWVIVSSDELKSAGGIDLTDYYTRYEVDTIITDLTNNYNSAITNIIESMMTSGEVITYVQNYLAENNYIKAQNISYEDYLDMPAHDANTLYITGIGNFLGDTDMCCGGGGGGGSDYWNVSPTAITAGYTGLTVIVNVMSNTAHTMTTNESWIHISPVSGLGYQQYQVVIDANTGDTASARTSTIYVGDKTISVFQDAVPYVRVSPTAITANYEEGSYQINVSSNTNHSASTNVSWITISPSSGSGDFVYTITLTENGSTARSGNVYIGGNVISVSQNADTTDYSSMNLTLKILSAGTVGLYSHQADHVHSEFKYSVNGGEWQSRPEYLTQYGTFYGYKINVEEGDIVEWKNLGPGGLNDCRLCSTGDTYFKTYGNTSSITRGGAAIELFRGSNVVDAKKLVIHIPGCDMFAGCVHLKTPPMSVIGAAGMFSGCISLTSAPKLPRTSVGEGQYSYMFSGCTSLVNAPELPATSISSTGGSEYAYMFEGCTSLTTVPSSINIPISTSSCEGMFKGCSNITSSPSLPATTLGENCYKSMFEGCTSLVNAPALPATYISKFAYLNMFKGCTSLVNAPELPATSIELRGYEGMFEGCTSLVSGPTTISGSTNTGYTCVNMFSGCTSLVNAPALPSTNISEGCYEGMFRGCTSLVNAPALPAKRLAVKMSSNSYFASNYVYKSMFEGCTSLVNAPELPALTGTTGCYENMFSGCTNLSYIKCLTKSSLSNASPNWVAGVSQTGTFVKKSGANWSTGDSGIPSGWTIEEVS